MDSTKQDKRGGEGEARPQCLEPEVVAAYVDGRLEPALLRVVEAHLAGCSDCREWSVETADCAGDLEALGRRAPAQRRWYLSPRVGLAAAAAVASLVSVRLLLREQPRTALDVGQLVQAVGPRRPIEARLSGGFQHGPRTGQTRSGPGMTDAPPEVVIAAARIEQALARERDGQSLIAFGAAELLLGRVDASVAALDEAQALTPGDPAVWINLSAAYLEKSRRVASMESHAYLSKATEAAERATRIAPGAPEPWFNLATVEAASGKPSAETWRQFLRVERDPAWAAEGRRQLDAITAAGP
jgi:tetratricopeptide (TPR) repeat protein